ncbi:uncharacterized protein EAF01_006355 [Botrytis porri]|uniref:uncharacterized protein n=1 Tax=Botrytis porri TaxID=87229 RepID=UPI0018FFB048|nr:uncharacterized protein EAF01_006355 [Botrytis porri]KAF7903306.1 hypothetical protein EAF01_006355 [Botrytis porri]
MPFGYKDPGMRFTELINQQAEMLTVAQPVRFGSESPKSHTIMQEPTRMQDGILTRGLNLAAHNSVNEHHTI